MIAAAVSLLLGAAMLVLWLVAATTPDDRTPEQRAEDDLWTGVR